MRDTATQAIIDEEHRKAWEKANAPVRTAEDERRDLLAFMTSIHKDVFKRYVDSHGAEDTTVIEGTLRMLLERLTRGDHVGAATR
jgi:hypothetical protein